MTLHSKVQESQMWDHDTGKIGRENTLQNAFGEEGCGGTTLDD